jgi:protein TonB
MAEPGAPGAGMGSGGPGGVGRGPEGVGRGALGEGNPADLGDEYLERLRRWLARYKHYPEAALDRKQEGQVLLGFTLARDGTVLKTWIERSSGSPIIDRAALQMMHDGSPVPPIPPSFHGQQVTLAMPVDYSIGFFDKLFR